MEKVKEKDYDQVLEENHDYFDFYLVMPKVITIILAIVVFIVGLGMGISEEIGPMFGIWIAGSIVCALGHYLMRVTFSYKILHIYYLKKLAEKDEIKQENDKAL